MGGYSYCTFENDRLRMRGLHHNGFPLLLWDALVQTGYGDRAPEYYGRLYEEHGLQRCEVYVDIPSHPVFPDGRPWSMWAIGPTWMMLWRRLLTWHSLPCARSTWLLLRACPSHCILSRTDLTQSGRLAWMRWTMSFRFITTVAGHTWSDMPSICFSCSTMLSASSRSSDAILLAMPRKSRASPRRSAARPRRLVPCVSRSGTWRVAFMTRKKHF
jgi:hypothetical protein